MPTFCQYKETIAAVATPPGHGGVGIVRISGPLSKTIAKIMVGFEPKVRYAHHAKFYAHDSELIDEGILLFFQAPNSFTGEDVAELQGHGGPVVMDRLLRCAIQHGARFAKPGEFSEQAFLNNKLDLTQAEAIADLINAESEQAARGAIRSLQGEFSTQIHHLVQQLIQLRMYVEAAIDFPEEEIDFLTQSHVLQEAKNIINALEQLFAKAQQGALLSEGITVVIAGAPNVGKSSLLNFLSGRDCAIVTDIAGTTRDILRQKIILDGLPMHVIDTAGLRETQDIIEQEGIRRAKAALGTADLIVYLLDIEQAKNIDSALEALEKNIPPQVPSLLVMNKIDLMDKTKDKEQKTEKPVIYISVKEKRGMEVLIEQLKQKVGYQTSASGNFVARRRHLDALTRASTHITTGIIQLETYRAGELLAEELRLAQEALNSITGAFTSDDLLGEIFSSFCVGK